MVEGCFEYEYTTQEERQLQPFSRNARETEMEQNEFAFEFKQRGDCVGLYCVEVKRERERERER
jgi:hypothetical protein